MSLARNIIRILNETDDDNVLLIIEKCFAKKCRSLDLSYHSLTEIPQEIFKLKNLEFLNLSNNKLSELPVGIYRLDKLRELNISNNNFEYLDSNKLTKMKALKSLIISGHGIPEKITEKLRYLITG